MFQASNQARRQRKSGLGLGPHGLAELVNLPRDAQRFLPSGLPWSAVSGPTKAESYPKKTGPWNHWQQSPLPQAWVTSNCHRTLRTPNQHPGQHKACQSLLPLPSPLQQNGLPTGLAASAALLEKKMADHSCLDPCCSCQIQGAWLGQSRATKMAEPNAHWRVARAERERPQAYF